MELRLTVDRSATQSPKLATLPPVCSLYESFLIIMNRDHNRSLDSLSKILFFFLLLPLLFLTARSWMVDRQSVVPIYKTTFLIYYYFDKYVCYVFCQWVCGFKDLVVLGIFMVWKILKQIMKLTLKVLFLLSSPFYFWPRDSKET